MQQQHRKNARKHFFRKYAGTVAASAAGILLFSAVCVFLIIKWNTLPEQSGKPAAEVVRLFYDALDALEHGQLGTYTIGTAGALYEKPVMNLYFISTMRETFERKKPYYSPQECIALCRMIYTGIPAATEKEILYRKGIKAFRGGAVYGLSNLSITPREETGGNALFEVSFYYWLPLFPEEAAERLINTTPEELAQYSLCPLQITFHRDTVRLKKRNNAWYISDIHIEQRQPAVNTIEDLFDYFIDAKPLPPYLQLPAAAS